MARKKLQKVFALLMAVSMTMSLLSVTALANEEHPHKSVPCETCGGDGLTDTLCGTCDGKGMVSVKDEENGEISKSDCTACGGTGYEACIACNGTGYVACNGIFEAGETTESTCTEPGSTVYTCATCGASYEEEIPAKGHTVENWETTKEPTCTESGEKQGTCTACEQTVTETIPANGHTWQTENGVKTCTVCGAQEAALEDTGVTIVRQSAEGLTYNIGEGQVVMLASPDDTAPVVFSNCTFNLTGKTVKISGNQDGISYNNGETITKLWIGGNVQFDNCTFLADETGSKSSSAGYDACIYFFSGDIVLNGCTLSATGYNGQFLGLYGKEGSVTFDECNISTVNNRNGWSYAMYGGSVLKLLNGSTMTATGMSTDSGNTNAFYSGDNKTGYDAIFVKDSTIDFSDNRAGGFAINNVNIHVDNSTITVNNNLGNACNSGYWIVTNGSTITMNGNRGGHALSCIGFEMSDSTVEIMHNGYAGIYLQSGDSSFTNCSVDLRCNGEKLLSYTAGDLWLNGHTLTVSGGTSQTQEGSLWLGGVGRKGAVETTEGTTVVAYDLDTNAEDNLKSNTAPTLTGADLALNGEDNGHILFLNPFMTTPYARGNAERSASNNDADLFDDDNVTSEEDIISIENAKIGTLTDAQLAHHRYDWDNGQVIREAESENYGVIRYACLDCANYMSNTGSHPNSFDCAGTYVYAPAVALAFDANTTEPVTNLPDTQQVVYSTSGTEPSVVPVRSGYHFDGWYTTPDCTTPFDFSTILTENVTVYAKWSTEPGGYIPPDTPDPTPTPDPEDPTDIPDENVPEGELPEEPGEEIPDEDVPEGEVPEEIPDEDVPQGEAPKTGDMSLLYAALAGVSGLGLAGTCLLGRKKRDEE